MEEVVLVDEQDNEVGTEEKLRVHMDGGKLHRALSVFIFNSDGKMLLQKRADGKYHAGGLWTNACCTHPRPGESPEDAAHRRLKEEMGFDCPIKKAFTTVYGADVGGGLTEKEFDHVFIGEFDGDPEPDPEEASEFKWIDMAELLDDVERNPDKYTPWFRVLLPQLNNKYTQE